MQFEGKAAGPLGDISLERGVDDVVRGLGQVGQMAKTMANDESAGAKWAFHMPSLEKFSAWFFPSHLQQQYISSPIWPFAHLTCTDPKD